MGWLHKLDSGWFAVDMGLRALAERVETGIQFNPMTPQMNRNPHPVYRELREHDPIHRSRPADGWVLSRYADVVEVLGDRSFSSDERNLRRWRRFMRRRRLAGLPDPYQEDRVTMLRSDAPDHLRTRNLVNQAFTPRAVERMRTRIEEVVDELVTPLEGANSTELIADFAAPLPVVVIAEMLGIPAADRERFRHWSDEVVRTLGDKTLEDERAGEIANQELRAYFAEIADKRRAEPRDDLLSALVAAEEAGDRLTTGELLGTLVLLLVAGNETTTKLIGNAVVALLSNPDQLELLREEPKRIVGAVDELLRYDGPVQLTSRIVLEDRTFRGHLLRRGQQLVLLLAAANRDPEQYADPERLDVTRENVRHLAFGHGSHFCLGAQLARLEAGLALEALITRLPNLRFSGDPVEWGTNTVLRGPRVLPLAL
jgi:hypothetical protein